MHSPCLLAGVALAFVLPVGLGCSKPKPPTVAPKEVSVVAVDAEGLKLDTKVELTNPNAFSLTVQRAKAKVTLEGPIALGEVTVPQAISLPSNTPTPVSLPLTVKWESAAAFAAVAAKGKDIPFTVEGTITVGGEKLNVDLPYQQQGVLTQAQLRDAALRSIQKFLPR